MYAHCIGGRGGGLVTGFRRALVFCALKVVWLSGRAYSCWFCGPGILIVRYVGSNKCVAHW